MHHFWKPIYAIPLHLAMLILTGIALLADIDFGGDMKYIPIPYIDDLAHLTLFALVAFSSLMVILLFKRIGLFVAILLSFVWSFSVGISAEYFQEYLTCTRHFETQDILLNGIGIIFGIFPYVVYIKLRYK